MADDKNTDTTTSSTGSSSPVIRATLDKLFGGLGKAYDAGAPPAFNSSLYSPAGATTQAGWSSALTAANNPDYKAGIGTATKYENGLLRGGGLTGGQKSALMNTTALGGQYAGLADAYGQDAPGYQALRDKVSNDTLSSVNSVFNNSGRFGGGSNAKAAGEGVSSALSGLDYTNFTNDINNRYRSLDSQHGVNSDIFNMDQTGVGNAQTAANMLPQLFQSSLLPSAAMGTVGAAQDANRQGILQGNYDLFNRQHGNNLDWLSKLGGIVTGAAGSGGTTTTQTAPATPWWQSLLGLGISGAGALAHGGA